MNSETPDSALLKQQENVAQMCDQGMLATQRSKIKYEILTEYTTSLMQVV